MHIAVIYDDMRYRKENIFFLADSIVYNNHVRSQSTDMKIVALTLCANRGKKAM